ncbi:MAG: hypothetical protein IPK19_32950 [Chloroflexi bacterium]|nr:hypothetical protein [Chloroflexota bacterium]
MSVEQTLLKKRDAKALPHLQQYAPVWIVDQKVIPDDEAVQFNAVFQHPAYGWVTRRYRFDGFNNVLYHKGQVRISEDHALEVQQNDPYLSATVADIPNAYGG